jgi:ATP-dependent Zn protease
VTPRHAFAFLLLLAQAPTEENAQEAPVFLKLFYTILPIVIVGILLFLFLRRSQSSGKRMRYFTYIAEHAFKTSSTGERLL